MCYHFSWDLICALRYVFLLWCSREINGDFMSQNFNIYFYDNHFFINFLLIAFISSWIHVVMGTESKHIFHTHWNPIVWFSCVVLSSPMEPECLSHSFSQFFISCFKLWQLKIFKLYFKIVICTHIFFYFLKYQSFSVASLEL